MGFSSRVHDRSSVQDLARTRPERPRPAGRRPTARRLFLEALEDRKLLSSSTISLTPSEAAPQLVGDRITWTATVNNGTTDGLLYQFSDGPVNGPFQMVRDFSPLNTFTWVPMQEGPYKIKVTVEQGYGATDSQSAVVLDTVNSLVTGPDAVISPTSNPLVALYSAPPVPGETPSSPGELMHVEFSIAGPDPSWQSTDALPTVRGKSTNFLVAGMLPNTTYEMRHVLADGTASAPLFFTTGSLPTNLTFPTFTVQQAPAPGSDLSQGMIFHQFNKSPSNVPNPIATDLQGHVMWYYDMSRSGLTLSFPGQSLVPGGTVLLIGTDQYAPLPNSRDVLREVDMAGDTLRETNIAAVNAQLTAMGDDIIYSFNHDAERLPNGGTAIIGLTERPVIINGTPTEYVGMNVIVLDANFRVSWVWDAFDHLDVNRGPVLGEVLQQGSPQPTASVPILPAVDWLHLNAVSWSPSDQNLVLSLRHQDWVVKVDYENGAGDGHVIWRLGQGGDFTVNSTDPNPWFSHQHNAHYIDDHTLILFDNGNTRRATNSTADSRGQVWQIDEQTMTATLVLNVDLGSYSGALGAAQRLPNGDYSFTLGENGPEPPKPPAQTVEVGPDGTRLYDLMANRPEYRSFRIQTLYAGTGLPGDATGGGTPPAGSPGTASVFQGTGATDLTSQGPSPDVVTRKGASPTSGPETASMVQGTGATGLVGQWPFPGVMTRNVAKPGIVQTGSGRIIAAMFGRGRYRSRPVADLVRHHMGGRL